MLYNIFIKFIGAILFKDLKIGNIQKNLSARHRFIIALPLHMA